MKKLLIAALVLAGLLTAFGALAEETQTALPEQTPAPAEAALPEGVVTEYRWFVNSYKNVRTRQVTYYDNVYAYNHGK